ncbi:hypothetical protein ACFX11_029973 [Malus domestica]
MAEQGGEDGKLERASEHRCFSHGEHEVELAAAIGGGVDVTVGELKTKEMEHGKLARRFQEVKLLMAMLFNIRSRN